MQQTLRNTHVPHVPWSTKLTIPKPPSIATPTQGYPKNPNQMLYRMGQLSRTETREKAKEERNSHETKRTHITINANTKPKHLIHANQRPLRRATLNAASIFALAREKQA